MNVEGIEKLMYKDIANVYRYENITNPDKSTTKTLSLVPTLSNVPCRLSIKRNDDPKQNNGVNSSNVLYTLFTSSSRTFIKGDMLSVMHQGNEYKLVAAEPMTYDNNQQIPLLQEEWA